MPAKAVKTETQTVSIRMRKDTCALIDRAAEIRGKNRYEFMIEAAVAAAQEALLDQALVLVDRETYDFFLNVLDRPPSAEGLERLMKVTPPWLE